MLCTGGERIASSTSVDALFQHDFFLFLNDKRYLVKVAKEGRHNLPAYYIVSGPISIVGWVTIFGWANCIGMQLGTHLNSAWQSMCG